MLYGNWPLVSIQVQLKCIEMWQLCTKMVELHAHPQLLLVRSQHQQSPVAASPHGGWRSAAVEGRFPKHLGALESSERREVHYAKPGDLMRFGFGWFFGGDLSMVESCWVIYLPQSVLQNISKYATWRMTCFPCGCGDRHWSCKRIGLHFTSLRRTNRDQNQLFWIQVSLSPRLPAVSHS